MTQDSDALPLERRGAVMPCPQPVNLLACEVLHDAEGYEAYVGALSPRDSGVVPE